MTSPKETNPGSEPGGGSRDKGGGPLASEKGKTTIADSVVQKIAGVAAREVPGVHDIGTGAGRAMAAIRERIPGSGGPSVTQGVAVEVGEREAAVDLRIVVEYGVPISELAQGLRANVIKRIERMTGLSVVEVNINVDDIHLPEDDQKSENAEGPRVQ